MCQQYKAEASKIKHNIFFIDLCIDNKFIRLVISIEKDCQQKGQKL